jgi:anti-sigma regulatory factor (Ser/Thr protein kinase)
MMTVIHDPSQVGEARRRAGDLARTAGMTEARVGQFALAVTELATNIIKHGGGGQMLMGCFADADGSGIECVALDNGPGMADVERCLRDGYSTTSTPGNGLGAVQRQADLVRIYSRPGGGTAVLARFITGPASGGGLLLGTAMAIYPGELISGDGWALRRPSGGATLMVVDGSGHGMEAHTAAIGAIAVLEAHLEQDCVRIVERMHGALRPTRGAAVALVRIDMDRGVAHFVGVGNISGALIVNGEAQHMISYNGIVGYTAPRIRQFDYPIKGEALVILHSDGVSARWKVSDYPDLARQHPALIASVLLRDHKRGRDDATVVAMRVTS